MKNFSYRLCLIYFLLFVMVSTVSSACSNEERTSVVKNDDFGIVPRTGKTSIGMNDHLVVVVEHGIAVFVHVRAEQAFRPADDRGVGTFFSLTT